MLEKRHRVARCCYCCTRGARGAHIYIYIGNLEYTVFREAHFSHFSVLIIFVCWLIYLFWISSLRSLYGRLKALVSNKQNTAIKFTFFLLIISVFLFSQAITKKYLKKTCFRNLPKNRTSNRFHVKYNDNSTIYEPDNQLLSLFSSFQNNILRKK